MGTYSSSRKPAARRPAFAASEQDIQRQIAALETDIDQSQKALASLGADPAGVVGQTLARQNDLLPEYTRVEVARLVTQLSRDQTRYSILLQSVEDFRLAAARYTHDITVFAPAEIPLSPVKPRVLLNTLLGLASGLLLGVAGAFLLEYVDDTVTTRDHVSRTLGIPTLGSITRIPSIRKPPDGLVTARIAAWRQ